MRGVRRSRMHRGFRPQPIEPGATINSIFAATLAMARSGEIVISGSIDGAASARLTAAELDLVTAASPSLDMLHLRDGRVVAQVQVGFAMAAEGARLMPGAARAVAPDPPARPAAPVTPGCPSGKDRLVN